MSRKVIDISGSRFGRLFVVRFAGRRGHYSMWECLCDCGNTKTLRGCSIKRGDTRSCGCLFKENAWDHPTKFPSQEDAAWAFNYRQYLRNAKARKIDCSLSFERFKDLSSRPCHYCGLPPEKRPSQRGRSSIFCSGIDRVDNSRGYVDGNIVPCCTWCNRAKNNCGADEFVKNCIRVASHNKAQESAIAVNE